MSEKATIDKIKRYTTPFVCAPYSIIMKEDGSNCEVCLSPNVSALEAEIEQLTLDKDRYYNDRAVLQQQNLDQSKEIERLKAENEAMRKDIEVIGDSLFIDCYGGSDPDEAWSLIDNWRPKENN